MKTNKTKLSIRVVEVEGSAETITSIVKSLGDLFPGNGEPSQGTLKMPRTKRTFPTVETIEPKE
jgi:hypothetical protein